MSPNIVIHSFTVTICKNVLKVVAALKLKRISLSVAKWQKN